jgi:hypothetical protein
MVDLASGQQMAQALKVAPPTDEEIITGSPKWTPSIINATRSGSASGEQFRQSGLGHRHEAS